MWLILLYLDILIAIIDYKNLPRTTPKGQHHICDFSGADASIGIPFTSVLLFEFFPASAVDASSSASMLLSSNSSFPGAPFELVSPLYSV